MERAVGTSLRALSQLARSPLMTRLGLNDSVEKLLYQGTKASLRAVNRAMRHARPLVKVLEPVRMIAAEEGAQKPALFDLTPTDSQKLVRDTMTRFAKKRMRGAALAADEACAPPPSFLDDVNELGLAQLSVPGEFGGAGEARSMVTNVLVAEDLARGDMGLALAALAPLAVVHALVDFGTAEQQGTYLPAFAGDSFYPAALALLERRPLFDPHHLATRALRQGGDYVLSGEKALVPLAEDAELLLVFADLSGKPEAFLVDKGAEGLSIEPEPAMSLRAAKLGRVKLDRVRVPKASLLGGEDGIAAGRIIDLARIAWGALCVGTCSAVLDYVKAYCSERVAFGEPITHRQAVAFAIADIAVELDAMRLMVYRAASRAEQGLPFEREAALARIQCAEKGMYIGTTGVQLLGGHGFVKEHPLELWYRQLRAIGVSEGAVSV